MVCELQLHHKLFYRHKKISHSMYKIARIFEVGDENLAYNYADQNIRSVVGDKVYKVEEKKDDLEEEDGAEAVRVWLRDTVKLEQYFDALLEEGYERLEDFEDIEEDELIDVG